MALGVSSAVPPTQDRFYDGNSAASTPSHIELAGETVAIRDAAGRQLAVWPLGSIRVIDENQQNGTMTFACSEVEGPRLVLFPSDARRALLAARPTLQHWRRHRGLIELRTVAIWSGVMIAIVAAGYFGWRPLAGTIATAVPPAWEERLGATIRAALTDSMRTCEGRDGIAALEALVERIAPDTLGAQAITIDVVREGQPNALALPGNHILVFEGLIAEADAPEMLAGVLAHEIGHLDLHHPTRRLIEQLGLGVIVSVAFGGSDVGNASLLLATLSYSREAEAEADDRAILLLEQAGIRSDGLARFFEKIAADMPFQVPDWLSTHPDLGARAAANPGTADGDGGLDDEAWAAVKAACNRTTDNQ
jgi:Zn-dependent protease with chaperone function